MDKDQFAFMNQQLAAMLRDGVPLEGALRRLCQTMHRGRMRNELAALEADLAAGTPLREALPRRRLPDFYVRMVQVGLEGDDLPGMLTLLADYYQQSNSLWTRLKGVMVYPFIVLLSSLALSVWLAHVVQSSSFDALRLSPIASAQGYLGIFRMSSIVNPPTAPRSGSGAPRASGPPAGRLSEPDAAEPGVWAETWVTLWAPPLTLTILIIVLTLAVGFGPSRRWLRWHLPGFREASLSQFAFALELMIRGGSHLKDALELLRHLERGTALGAELARWQERIAQGHGRFETMTVDSRLFPPLFRWLVASAGEDLAAGLRRAGQTYQNRAFYYRELLVNAALPVSLIALGLMVLGQVYPFTTSLFQGLAGLADLAR
jgi:type II secretory pathway component PulF